jgi:3-hydroxybutyrate dehydrogenase
MHRSMKIKLAAGSASRALAGAGANVLLNGFGEQALIENLLAELRSQYKVKAAYSAADMSKYADFAAGLIHLSL